MKNLENYNLLIFDLDGTLSEYKTGELLTGVREYFHHIHNPEKHKLALASNQGGVGLGYWMYADGFGDHTKYPTVESANKAVDDVLVQLGHDWAIYISYAYRTQKGQWAKSPASVSEYRERWSHHWRKPNPGMLFQAMTDYGISHKYTLMVGDWDEDKQAASRAECDFEWAHIFFNREKPSDTKR